MFKLSSRSIPLHKPSLKRMTDQAVKALKDSLESRKIDDRPVSESLGKGYYRNVGVYFVDTVRGKRLEVPVSIQLGSKRSPSWLKYVVGGYIDSQKTRLVIKLNPNKSIRQFLDNLQDFSKEFYRVLSHEVTHLRDVLKEGDLAATDDKGSVLESELTQYYNSPHEVRAFMRNLIDEVERYSEEYAKDSEWFEVDESVVEKVLDKSETWRRISKHLNSSNRRKLLKAVYRAMKDLEPELKEKYEVSWDDDDWTPPSRFENWVEDTSESLGFKVAARPIRLPIRDIKRLAKDLTRKLRMRGLPKPNRVVAEENLTLSNVKGDPVAVEISLVGSPALDFDNRDLIRGAYFKRSKPVKGLPSWASPLPSKLVIYLNSYLPTASFEKRPDRVVEDELYKILTHELTHSADIWSGKGSVGDLSKSRKELKRHHHNHPAEVRALMREVADEVDSAVRDYVEMGMGFNQSVRYALKDSKWVDIEPYLNSKSKKTILKGVHTHLHDQGLNKTAAYDPKSWYFDYEKGLSLETIIDRWQKHKPRQKLYDRDQPIMVSTKELWPLREYTWTRDKARSGYAKVKDNSVWLEGHLKWDALKEDMKRKGWDKSDPLRLNIGSKGVKVGEGNHRLAIARELGLREIPVRLIYYNGAVTKSPMSSQEPVIEVSPKAFKEVVKSPQKEMSPEEEEAINDLLEYLKFASPLRVSARYHSCQNGGPCMCGGSCGGDKNAEGYKMPRKFDKKHCDSKSCDDMGFSEKASCRPYKDCYAQSKKASPIHKLAPLPFDYDALEPWIGAETVKLHHDVHQKKYVDGLNEAEKGIAICRATGDFTQLPMWNSKHAFNWGGAYLHTIYWKCLNGPVPMSRRLEDLINRDFGSVETLKDQMQAASKGIQGSGWVVLVLHRSMAGDRLSVSQVMNHDHKSLWNSVVLLPIDMWEHAYYLDYKNDKGEHLNGVLDNLINWKYVESRL